jgi:hypothetical protein
MQRPTSVTVLGILNLLFGGLGLLGIVMTLAMVLNPKPRGWMLDPAINVVQENPGYAHYARIGNSIGLVANIVLIAAGFGLLLLKPWGRVLSIGFSGYAILSEIVDVFVTGHYVLPLLEKASHMPNGPQKAAMTGAAVGGIVGPCFVAIYPLILLLFMFRPNVKAVLQLPCDAESVED